MKKTTMWVRLKKMYQNSLAGVFQWPKNNDRDQVLPKFIFCRNLEVTNDEKNTSVYLVKHLEGIRTKFRNFSRKDFLQDGKLVLCKACITGASRSHLSAPGTVLL